MFGFLLTSFPMPFEIELKLKKRNCKQNLTSFSFFIKSRQPGYLLGASSLETIAYFSEETIKKQIEKRQLVCRCGYWFNSSILFFRHFRIIWSLFWLTQTAMKTNLSVRATFSCSCYFDHFPYKLDLEILCKSMWKNWFFRIFPRSF